MCSQCMFIHINRHTRSEMCLSYSDKSKENSRSKTEYVQFLLISYWFNFFCIFWENFHDKSIKYQFKEMHVPLCISHYLLFKTFLDWFFLAAKLVNVLMFYVSKPGIPGKNNGCKFSSFSVGIVQERNFNLEVGLVC